MSEELWNECNAYLTERAANAAYEEAGIGPGDLDLVECQDTDAASELVAYRDLGLCPPGDEARAIDFGARSEPVGAHPDPQDSSPFARSRSWFPSSGSRRPSRGVRDEAGGGVAAGDLFPCPSGLGFDR